MAAATEIGTEKKRATTTTFKVPTIMGIKPYLGLSEIGCQMVVEKKSLKLASFLTSGLISTGRASRKTNKKIRITPKMAKKEERKIILSIMNSDRRNLFLKPRDLAWRFFSRVSNFAINQKSGRRGVQLNAPVYKLTSLESIQLWSQSPAPALIGQNPPIS